MCILSLPARIAAVWFGPDQVSSATSVGVFGNQVSSTRIKHYLITHTPHGDVDLLELEILLGAFYRVSCIASQVNQ